MKIPACVRGVRAVSFVVLTLSLVLWVLVFSTGARSVLHLGQLSGFILPAGIMGLCGSAVLVVFPQVGDGDGRTVLTLVSGAVIILLTLAVSAVSLLVTAAYASVPRFVAPGGVEVNLGALYVEALREAEEKGTYATAAVVRTSQQDRIRVGDRSLLRTAEIRLEPDGDVVMDGSCQLIDMETGQVVTGEYRYGSRFGTWRARDKDGRVLWSIAFRWGRECGEWRFHTANGDAAREFRWSDGGEGEPVPIEMEAAPGRGDDDAGSGPVNGPRARLTDSLGVWATVILDKRDALVISADDLNPENKAKRMEVSGG